MRTLGIALRNLALGANARSLLAARRPRQFVQLASETLFFQHALLGRRGLPERSILEAFGSSTAAVPVQLARAGQEIWWGASASMAVDLVSLCLLCRSLDPAPMRVFEIGTNYGGTALHFALNTPPGARVFTLDLPPGGSAALRTTAMDDAHIRGHRGVDRYAFDGFAEAAKIECLFGDSAHFDFGPYEGNIDIFFVDGAHSYEYVRSDTERALRCCRPGGVIAWHDFGRFGLNGVSRYLHELRRASGRAITVVPGGSLAYVIV